ncbi:hypothetical protein H4219_006256 [Mycoemilia scoparia]|uniref:Protein kinase domain-containing protein n=1 Tax=Mycoemilia scoparia TaxID=417184 RepID=A0A9W7ZKW8_9FUNG|nr:hypothetical protein H4219_006256 [Mycoemilia scoparia]
MADFSNIIDQKSIPSSPTSEMELLGSTSLFDCHFDGGEVVSRDEMKLKYYLYQDKVITYKNEDKLKGAVILDDVLLRVDEVPLIKLYKKYDTPPDNMYLKVPCIPKNNPWHFNCKNSMRREIRNLTEIKHPNIPKLHGYREQDGYILGLYIDKYDITLEDLLESKVDFDRNKFFAKLCEIVKSIHKQGYVHADMHELNIMVKKGNLDEPFLIDFDSAEKIGTKTSRQSKYLCEYRVKTFTENIDNDYLVDIKKLLGIDEQDEEVKKPDVVKPAIAASNA